MKIKVHTDSIDNMTNIIDALGEAGRLVVFPVHPRTEKYLREYGLLMPGNVKLIKPLGYLDMLRLMANAGKILTDSGGIQKEAYVPECRASRCRRIQNGWRRWREGGMCWWGIKI